MADRAGALARNADLFTYDRFEVGEAIGTTRFAVDDAMLDDWERLYGYRPGDEALPLAFAPVLVMRAFLAIVSPRPPGNLHVGQSYHIRQMPKPHQSVFAEVFCSAKELRKMRRVISFAVELADTDGAAPRLSGISTMFWAA